jgi:GT2 family glycosyltransferase
MRIAVLVTCHNRVEVTIRGLGSLVDALSKAESLEYDLFVVDDGSKDGTALEIARKFPQAHIDVGDGSLFWNGGMCRAYSLARRRGSFSEYLLFNDDVVVNPEALAPFLSEYRVLNSKSPAILAAATLNNDGAYSYSAYVRPSKLRPLTLQKMGVTDRVQPCDTFNGNFVLVPARFFESIGGLDPYYVHAYGDIDLGYVAKKAGVQPHLASTPIGFCQANEASVQKGGRLLQALRGSWAKRDSLGQRVHFLRKHSSLTAQLITVPITMVRYGFDQLSRRIQS